MKKLVGLPLVGLVVWLVACSDSQEAITGPEVPGISKVISGSPGDPLTWGTSDLCGDYDGDEPQGQNVPTGALRSPCDGDINYEFADDDPSNHVNGQFTPFVYFLPSLVGAPTFKGTGQNLPGLDDLGVLQVIAVPVNRDECEAQALDDGITDDDDQALVCRGRILDTPVGNAEGTSYSTYLKTSKRFRGGQLQSYVPFGSTWQIIVQLDFDLDGDFEFNEDVATRIVIFGEPQTDSPNDWWARIVNWGSNVPISFTMEINDDGCFGTATGQTAAECLTDFSQDLQLTLTNLGNRSLLQVTAQNNPALTGTYKVIGHVCDDAAGFPFPTGLDIPWESTSCVHYTTEPALPAGIFLEDTWVHMCEAPPSQDYLVHMQHRYTSDEATAQSATEGDVWYTLGLPPDPVVDADIEVDCINVFAAASYESTSLWGKLAGLFKPQTLVARHSDTRADGGTTRSSFFWAVPTKQDPSYATNTEAPPLTVGNEPESIGNVTFDDPIDDCPKVSTGSIDCATDPTSPEISASQGEDVGVTFTLRGHDEWRTKGATLRFYADGDGTVNGASSAVVPDSDNDGDITVTFNVGSGATLYVYGCGIAMPGSDTSYPESRAGILGALAPCPNVAPTDGSSWASPYLGAANGPLGSGEAGDAFPAGWVDPFTTPDPNEDPSDSYFKAIALNNHPMVVTTSVCASPVVDGLKADGVSSPATEWADNGCYAEEQVTVNVGGKDKAVTGTVRWFVDASKAYFSVFVPLSKQPNKANIAFDFDGGDGSAYGPHENDDQIVASNAFDSNGTAVIDGYLEINCANRSSETPCNTNDLDNGGNPDNADAAIAYTTDPNTGEVGLFYEVSQEINTGDLYDIGAGFPLAGQIGFGFQLGVGNVRNAGNFFPQVDGVYYQLFPFDPSKSPNTFNGPLP